MVKMHAWKAGCLVLLALLAAPGPGLDAGGGLSTCWNRSSGCRKKAKRVVPVAAVTTLALGGLGLPAARQGRRVPAGGARDLSQAKPAADPGSTGGTGGVAAAVPLEGRLATGGAGAGAGEPVTLYQGPSTWKNRWKSKELQAELARTPAALSLHRAQALDAMVQVAQRAYGPELCAGDQPDLPATRWKGREIEPGPSREQWPPARELSAPRLAVMAKEAGDLAKPGMGEAHRDAARQLVAEFEGSVCKALKDYRASKAPDRDRKLDLALLDVRLLKGKELDSAARYYADLLGAMWPDMDDLDAGTYDQRLAFYQQHSPGIYECLVRVDNAAEKYLHYVLPLVLRVVRPELPVFDELQEELFRQGFAVPFLLDHVARNAPEEEPLALGRQPKAGSGKAR